MALGCVLTIFLAAALVSPAGTLAFVLLPGSPSSSDTHFSVQVQVLQEVVAGPLAGRSLVLYLDPAIGPQTLEQITMLAAIRDSPLVLVNLGGDGQKWCKEQSVTVLRAEFFIHVAVFVTDPQYFFRSVVNTDTRWKPKHFLMFSLSSDLKSKILTAEEFSRPESIVMFKPHNSRKNTYDNQMEMFTFFPFSQKDIVSLGHWSAAAELSPTDIFVDRFSTFEGYKFSLASWLDDYPYLYQAKNKPEDEGDGLVVEVLNALAAKLNYSFDFTITPPDAMWGNFENGSWNGMLGMIYKREKNFTVNYFGYTEKRMEDFDATVSYWMEGFGLALLKPEPFPRWRNVYYPFTPVVWASVAFSLLVITVAFYLQDRIQTKPVLGNFDHVWSYVLRPVLSHSLPRLPRTHNQRVFVAAWWMACLIITTAYTANLIAFLTIPLYPKRLQTVQELADSNFRVSMMDYGEFVPQALKSSQDKYYHALGEKLDLYDGEVESIIPVLNGSHAFLESYSYNLIQFWNTYQARNIYMLREQIYPGHLCWYFGKNTAWKNKFDVGIQHVVEAGLIVYWFKNKTEDFLGIHFESKLRSDGDTKYGLPLTLGHTQGLFFLLIVGWSSSAVSFVREIASGQRN